MAHPIPITEERKRVLKKHNKRGDSYFWSDGRLTLRGRLMADEFLAEERQMTEKQAKTNRKMRIERIRGELAKLADVGVEGLAEWLDEIYRDQGAMEAFKCYMSLLEFSIPKLARVEAKIESEHTEVRRLEVVGAASPWRKRDMESQHTDEKLIDVHPDVAEVTYEGDSDGH